MATYNHFYDLPVYKTCRIFRKKISVIIKKCFPKLESYHLTAQVLDSSRSVTANIAEGFLEDFIIRRIFSFADRQEARLLKQWNI
jgi:four helix bundle protein